MRKLIFTILPLLLFSCVNEYALDSAFPTHNLHANSAKVWILSKSSNFDDYKLPEMHEFRKTFIFYSNLSFREQELIHLGTDEGSVGKYSVNKDESGIFYLTLYYYQKRTERYRIVKIKNDYLKIQNLEGNQTEWELKTLRPPAL